MFSGNQSRGVGFKEVNWTDQSSFLARATVASSTGTVHLLPWSPRTSQA
ncbi:MAG: hypothetical protein ACO2YY_07060 [Pseudohongiellaceae bacterium]